MPKPLDTMVLIDHSIGIHGAVAVVRRLFAAPATCSSDAVVAEALSSGSEEERRAISRPINALEYVATSPGAAAACWAGEARRRRGVTEPRALGDALIGGLIAPPPTAEGVPRGLMMAS